METKTSIQALGKNCETVEDLIKLNGFFEDLNSGKEITFVVDINRQEGKSTCADLFAERLIEDLNAPQLNERVGGCGELSLRKNPPVVKI